MEPRERVRRHRAGQTHEERDPRRDEDAVEVVTAEGDLLEDFRVVLRLPFRGEWVELLDLREGLEAGEDHPGEGRQHAQGEQHEEHVARAESPLPVPPPRKAMIVVHPWFLSSSALCFRTAT